MLNEYFNDLASVVMAQFSPQFDIKNFWLPVMYNWAKTFCDKVEKLNSWKFKNNKNPYNPRWNFDSLS